MSDTTPDSTTALHTAPTSELTAAQSAIHAELARLTEPVTATELALAAGVGRSTAGKALTTLEERGLAVRIPGGYNGARRTPDHWHPATNRETASGDNPPEPTHDRPEPSDTEPRPTTSDADSDNPPSDETPADTPSEPDNGITDQTPAPTTHTLQDAPPPHAEHEGSNDSRADNPRPHADDKDGTENNDVPAPQARAEGQAASTEVMPMQGGKKRLAPGALRQMVIEHLQAHPEEAFTATKLSRAIEKSSGAIANALALLARQGIAEQVTDKPRTYRAATK